MINTIRGENSIFPISDISVLIFEGDGVLSPDIVDHQVCIKFSVPLELKH
jgi:hypothetical protein